MTIRARARIARGLWAAAAVLALAETRGNTAAAPVRGLLACAAVAVTVTTAQARQARDEEVLIELGARMARGAPTTS